MLLKKYAQSLILFLMIETSLISFYLIEEHIHTTRVTITIIAVAIVYVAWLAWNIWRNRE